MLAAAAVLFAGCIAPIDWSKRVGTYTYDQAVIELGPPDKQAQLSTGEKVAEWVTHYNNTTTTAIGTGYWGYPGGVTFIQTTGPTYYDRRLRLVFSTNDVLESWSRK